jgi:phosphonate transport system permease protein
VSNAAILTHNGFEILGQKKVNLSFGEGASKLIDVLDKLYFGQTALTQKALLILPLPLLAIALGSILFLRQSTVKDWFIASHYQPDPSRTLTVDLILKEEQDSYHYRIVAQLYIIILGVGILIYTAFQNDLNAIELFQNRQNMVDYISRYFPKNEREFSLFYTNWSLYILDTLETVGMGLWGTLLAAIVGAPLGILGAANICPKWLVSPVRRLMDAMRAINEIVFALIFVVAVGLGPFAGILALFVHTAGTLGKLFSEAVESIESGPVEGIRATGAGKIQEILFGVIPQVLPLWISYTLYRFEANVRSASVLGIVGAGGIGVSLYQSFTAFQYQQVCAILLILIITVSCIDALSSKVRSQLV